MTLSSLSVICLVSKFEIRLRSQFFAEGIGLEVPFVQRMDHHLILLPFLFLHEVPVELMRWMNAMLKVMVLNYSLSIPTLVCAQPKVVMGVGTCSSANITLESADSAGLFSRAINLFLNILHCRQELFLHPSNLFISCGRSRGFSRYRSLFPRPSLREGSFLNLVHFLCSNLHVMPQGILL